MAIRFYLIPQAGTGTGSVADGNYLRPAYLREAGVTVSQSAKYGVDGTYFVGADVTAAQHAAINANADVTAIPANLDQQIGAALTQVQNALESLRIPAGWVTDTMTYRFVIAKLRRLFAFMQRFGGINRRSLFQPGITLDTTMSELTQAQRNALQAVADDLRMNLSTVTGTTTVRQVLKLVADQMPSQPMLGEDF